MHDIGKPHQVKCTSCVFVWETDGIMSGYISLCVDCRARLASEGINQTEIILNYDRLKPDMASLMLQDK